MENLVVLHALSEVKGLGPVKLRNLIESSSPAVIMSGGLNEFNRVKGITTSIAEKILERMRNLDSSWKFIKEQKALAARAGGRIISILDREYPQTLRESPACHGLLYALGNVGQLDRLRSRAIAIVGTRKASKEGLRKSYEFGQGLARVGYCIVSGLAEGIDSKAHMGCMDGDGFTVAVVGSGPDVVYPRSSEEVRRRIIQTGVVLSEFPFGTPIHKLRLVKRNKTLVGLSNWLLVVETGKKGGTLNSVRAARAQRKRIFVDIPRNPKLRTVQGNLDLIRSIVPVENPSQVLHEIRKEEGHEQNTLL